ncbi:hypothetical protein MRX96_005339 [Rhipicephalus microplus]
MAKRGAPETRSENPRRATRCDQAARGRGFRPKVNTTGNRVICQVGKHLPSEKLFRVAASCFVFLARGTALGACKDGPSTRRRCITASSDKRSTDGEEKPRRNYSNALKHSSWQA